MRQPSGRCRATPPDVVLLDVEMPGLSGYDVLAEMQADVALAGIPVIFLSGQVSAEHVASGLRLGAHDYLRKPVETGELLARVTSALRTKALQDRAAAATTPSCASWRPIDPLTGVLDVRGLQERLQVAAEDAQARQQPLAGVLVDVQSLDTINNAFGWAVGDEVLCAIAELVRAMVGPGEAVGRCGPDEFLVLLPATELAAAEVFARTIQLRIGALGVPAADGEVAVRASVGAAVTTTGNAEELLRTFQSAIAAGSATAPAAAPPEMPRSDHDDPGRSRRRWTFSRVESSVATTSSRSSMRVCLTAARSRALVGTTKSVSDRPRAATMRGRSASKSTTLLAAMRVGTETRDRKCSSTSRACG